MVGICNWVVRVFAVLYLLALAALAIGSFGLFGEERDPLSGVFLMPLGLPWVLWSDGLPEAARPWAAILAPALNLVLLAGLCRLAGRTPRRP